MSDYKPRLTADGLYYGGSAHKYYWDPEANPGACSRLCMANCTTYAYGRALETGAPAPVSAFRNARDWYKYVANGWEAIPYEFDAAEPGDILCYSGKYNHVSVVEAVDRQNRRLTTSQSNYRSRDTGLTMSEISAYFARVNPNKFFNIANQYYGGMPTYILKSPLNTGKGQAQQMYTKNQLVSMMLAFTNSNARRSTING